jgi:MFS family permease
MGGEWASGAALVSETWPAEHRGKALGLMQSCWAIGYGAAAIVTALILPRYGWRAVFLVGVLPALFTLWIRRRIREPAMWHQARAEPSASATRFRDAFRGDLVFLTIVLTLMNAATMFAWWGLNLWIPAYLSLPVAQGGIGLSTVVMSSFVVAMQIGMWFGYVTFGFVSDRFGRKPTYVVYLVSASVLVLIYSLVKSPGALLALGPFVAFFGTGYFSGFGAITAEIYPTTIRATAQGFTYNIGRLASAAAPFVVGATAQTRGFGTAFMLTSLAFLIAASFWSVIPETRGRELG